MKEGKSGGKSYQIKTNTGAIKFVFGPSESKSSETVNVPEGFKQFLKRAESVVDDRALESIGSFLSSSSFIEESAPSDSQPPPCLEKSLTAENTQGQLDDQEFELVNGKTSEMTLLLVTDGRKLNSEVVKKDKNVVIHTVTRRTPVIAPPIRTDRGYVSPTVAPKEITPLNPTVRFDLQNIRLQKMNSAPSIGFPMQRNEAHVVKQGTGVTRPRDPVKVIQPVKHSDTIWRLKERIGAGERNATQSSAVSEDERKSIEQRLRKLSKILSPWKPRLAAAVSDKPVEEGTKTIEFEAKTSTEEIIMFPSTSAPQKQTFQRDRELDEVKPDNALPLCHETENKSKCIDGNLNGTGGGTLQSISVHVEASVDDGFGQTTAAPLKSGECLPTEKRSMMCSSNDLFPTKSEPTVSPTICDTSKMVGKDESLVQQETESTTVGLIPAEAVAHVRTLLSPETQERRGEIFVSSNQTTRGGEQAGARRGIVEDISNTPTSEPFELGETLKPSTLLSSRAKSITNTTPAPEAATVKKGNGELYTPSAKYSTLSVSNAHVETDVYQGEMTLRPSAMKAGRRSQSVLTSEVKSNTIQVFSPNEPNEAAKSVDTGFNKLPSQAQSASALLQSQKQESPTSVIVENHLSKAETDQMTDSCPIESDAMILNVAKPTVSNDVSQMEHALNEKKINSAEHSKSPLQSEVAIQKLQRDETSPTPVARPADSTAIQIAAKYLKMPSPVNSKADALGRKVGGKLSVPDQPGLFCAGGLDWCLEAFWRPEKRGAIKKATPQTGDDLELQENADEQTGETRSAGGSDQEARATTDTRERATMVEDDGKMEKPLQVAYKTSTRKLSWPELCVNETMDPLESFSVVTKTIDEHNSHDGIEAPSIATKGSESFKLTGSRSQRVYMERPPRFPVNSTSEDDDDDQTAGDQDTMSDSNASRSLLSFPESISLAPVSIMQLKAYGARSSAQGSVLGSATNSVPDSSSWKFFFGRRARNRTPTDLEIDVRSNFSQVEEPTSNPPPVNNPENNVSLTERDPEPVTMKEVDPEIRLQSILSATSYSADTVRTHENGKPCFTCSNPFEGCEYTSMDEEDTSLAAAEFGEPVKAYSRVAFRL